MFGTPEILLIILVVLLLFGGKKIPELMQGMGRGVKSFKDGMNGIDSAINSAPKADAPKAENTAATAAEKEEDNAADA